MNISIKREQNNARISSAEREKFGAKLKTKNIFKALAVAMLMPAMLLTTACSNEDDALNNAANTENTINKGYALPVTVNVTRQGDAATRATYNESTKKLAFSAGDKLFVRGSYNDYHNDFAGTLDYDAESGKFSGTIYTQDDTYKTYEALFGNSNYINATLLPAGYEDHGYLVIKTNDPDAQYDDYIDESNEYTLATSKADGVAQFSYEESYNYNDGFALSPENAILNFTITGLAASTSVNVSLKNMAYNITGTVTTDASGTATFAAGINEGFNLQPFSLTVGGNPITLVSSDKVVDEGKIYNITRSTGATVDLSTKNSAYTAQNGETLTGTLANNVKISIADGATVILHNVNINGSGTWESGNYAGITCEGDATIILSGTNNVKGFYNEYPGIYVPENKTVTIQGTGSLTASSTSSNGFGAGIGGGFGISCGNIEIQGGVITATGGSFAAGIGAGSGVGKGASTCGTITISGGTVTATGGDCAAGIGSGYAQNNPSTCGAISISGGTVSATAGTAGASAPAAIGKGAVDAGQSTCASVTITPGITSLTMTNGHSSATGIVSNFLNATAVNANATDITYMLPTSVTDPAITGGMATAGFVTSYNGGTKTWTITKK